MPQDNACPGCGGELGGPTGTGYRSGHVDRCLDCDREYHTNGFADDGDDFLRRRNERDPNYTGPRPAPDPAPQSHAATALAAARVDLVDLIRNGIPPRKYVPGASKILVAGKCHHTAATKKTGKSLALAVVMAVDIIDAGGIVVILDRENGADEYARRLECVLDARGNDPRLVQLIQANYRYHAWPALRLDWKHDFAAAVADADLVIFDSSRAVLSNLGLLEDKSDDYARFTDALIDPLRQADIATLILDNTGHDSDRARGSSAKGDLADIIFTLKRTEQFGLEQTGELTLAVSDSRIAEVTGVWTMELGGGVYRSWRRPGSDNIRARIRDITVAVLRGRQPEPISQKKLIPTLREHEIKGTEVTLRDILAELAADPTSGFTKSDGYGFYLTGGVDTHDTPRHPPGREGVSAPPFIGAPDTPVSNGTTPPTDDELLDRADRLQADHPNEAA